MLSVELTIMGEFSIKKYFLILRGAPRVHAASFFGVLMHEAATPNLLSWVA